MRPIEASRGAPETRGLASEIASSLATHDLDDPFRAARIDEVATQRDKRRKLSFLPSRRLNLDQLILLLRGTVALLFGPDIQLGVKKKKKKKP